MLGNSISEFPSEGVEEGWGEKAEYDMGGTL